LLSLENSVHAILSFEKYVTQMPPTVSQTLFQSCSKIFHHPKIHLLRDRRDFSYYALLYFRYGSRLRDENSAFEIPP